MNESLDIDEGNSTFIEKDEDEEIDMMKSGEKSRDESRNESIYGTFEDHSEEKMEK